YIQQHCIPMYGILHFQAEKYFCGPFQRINQGVFRFNINSYLAAGSVLTGTDSRNYALVFFFRKKILLFIEKRKYTHGLKFNFNTFIGPCCCLKTLLSRESKNTCNKFCREISYAAV